MRRLDATSADFDAQLRALQWSADADASVDATVASIIADVRARGDAAVLDHTARFDGVKATSVAALELPAHELEAALHAITAEQRSALEAAAERVRAYHERQLDAACRGFAYRDADGTLLGQKVTPLDRVGVYVPGGKAAYPSSVLMNIVPARVAGVGEVIAVVPTPQGQKNPLVLAAAHIAGVHRLFTIGGAQAVAALAFGTATIPRVDKITGPGNAYVASAKKQVFGHVGIDMIAGPSEILVLADGTTPPDWVAMDLFSQAEHDELAQSILLCPDAAFLDAVSASIAKLLPTLPREKIIRASLQGRGALIRTRSMEQACAISNRIAPEHIEISSADPHRWEPLLKHAGAIFLGRFTSESLGDYCAGPNHVLPTAGTARFSSPLGVYDFVKRSSLIEVSATGAQTLGRIASVLAHGEGLQAHARAAEMRLGDSSVRAEPVEALDVRPVRSDDVIPLIKLKVLPEQEKFVASNAVSLAQAAYAPAGRPFGLWAASAPVGFLLLYDARRDTAEPEDALWIWRLMVDAQHQRRGHGAAAMRWAIEEARRLGVASLRLSHVPDNAAGPFYEQLGFAYTGTTDEDGELEMRLALRGNE